MFKVLIVGLGGFIGSVSRYLMGGYVQRLNQNASFPLGTLVVNLVGCFFIGLLSQLAESRGFFSPEIRAMVFIGILGGFTTFSSFGNETLGLLRDGQITSAVANIAANLIAGLFLVWLGRTIAYLMWR